MSAQDDLILSIQFRSFTSGLPSYARNLLQLSMLAAFSAASIRNVKLWTENGTVRRNFINAQTDPNERHWRRAFATAVLGQRPIAGPTKSRTFDSTSPRDRVSFGNYIRSLWVGGDRETPAGLRQAVVGSDGSITLVYDADSDRMGEGEELDPDDPEWADIVPE